jgi:WD40 repeat protein
MDGRSLVAGITDGRILLWDVDTGNHRTFKVPEGMSMAYDIAFSEDGTRIMTAVRGHKVNTRTINMWDVSSGNLLETRLIEPGMVLSTDGSLVPVIIKPYVMTEGWIYSTAQNRRICWIPVDCRPSGNSLDVFNDRVAIGTEDGRVILFDFTDIDSYYKSLE